MLSHVKSTRICPQLSSDTRSFKADIRPTKKSLPSTRVLLPRIPASVLSYTHAYSMLLYTFIFHPGWIKMCNTPPKNSFLQTSSVFFVAIFSTSGYKFLPVKNMIVNTSLLIMFNLIFCFLFLLLFTFIHLFVSLRYRTYYSRRMKFYNDDKKKEEDNNITNFPITNYWNDELSTLISGLWKRWNIE